MEIKINKKIERHMEEYKSYILKNISKSNDEYENITYVLNNYKKLHISKEDLNKKTRIKNTVNLEDRCQALRANNSQCTRRKQKYSCFCGTHIKGTPYGKILENNNGKLSLKEEINIYTKEIQGITYYIDDKNNIYSSEEILNNSNNPTIIGRYLVKRDNNENNTYVRIT